MQQKTENLIQNPNSQAPIIELMNENLWEQAYRIYSFNKLPGRKPHKGLCAVIWDRWDMLDIFRNLTKFNRSLFLNWMLTLGELSISSSNFIMLTLQGFLKIQCYFLKFTFYIYPNTKTHFILINYKQLTLFRQITASKEWNTKTIPFIH